MSFVLEPYQLDAVAFLRTRRRAAVISPAGSGKTVMAAAALDAVATSRHRSERIKVGWMCNTVEQAIQARTALSKFPRLAGVAVFKIKCAAAGTDWSDRDVLVVDEAHHAASAEGWRKQVESCFGAVWGFTATPPEDREKLSVFRGLFHEVHTVPRDAVSSRIVRALVVFLEASDPDARQKIDDEVERELPRRQRTQRWLKETGRSKFVPSDGEAYAQVSWRACVSHGIVGNTSRTRKAVETATRHVGEGDSVLVLANQVDHCKEIALLTPGAEACWSDMGAKKRRSALERFAAGELKCLVATSLCDEGIDIPRANVLVLVSGGRSNAKTEQRTGRVLRQFAGKNHGVIYDFDDSCVHGLMGRHSRARTDLYRKLGYEVTHE